MEIEPDEHEEIVIERALVQFKNEQGEAIGAQYELPLDIDHRKLHILYNTIFNKDQDPAPYLFYLKDVEIKEQLKQVIDKNFSADYNPEKVLEIVCLPQAVY